MALRARTWLTMVAGSDVVIEKKRIRSSMDVNGRKMCHQPIDAVVTSEVKKRWRKQAGDELVNMPLVENGRLQVRSCPFSSTTAS